MFDQQEEMPTDTLVDFYGRQDGLTEDAITLMKAVYLACQQIAACARAQGWSRTQTINAVETLRCQGLLELIYDPERQSFQLK